MNDWRYLIWGAACILKQMIRSKHMTKWSDIINLNDCFDLYKYLYSHPKIAAWQCTHSCNLKCQMCSFWRIPSNAKGELSVDDVIVGAATLKEMGISAISISGGEPFLRKDLEDITQILSNFFFTTIISNGTLITRKRARRLSESGLDSISISIDFNNPYDHDKTRGACGVYEKVWRAIEILSEERESGTSHVNVLCVISNKNIGQIEDIVRKCHDLNVTVVCQPYCSLKQPETKEEFMLNEDISAYLLNIKRKFPNFITHEFILQKIGEYFINGCIPNCPAGKDLLNIDNQGNVSKCVEFTDDIVGNIVYDDANTLKSRLLKKYKENKCESCFYSCRYSAQYPFKEMMGVVKYLLEEERNYFLQHIKNYRAREVPVMYKK